MRVLVCAGGTGGGIYPALAAVSELQQMGVPTDDILWIGTKGEMEETLVTRTGLPLATIEAGPIVGVPVGARARNMLKMLRGVGAASTIMGSFQPDVMLMTGGYIAAPTAVAARRHHVPIVTYLPDVEPGATIRYTIPLTSQIACTTDGSSAFVPVEKMVVTGYPVRPDIRAATTLDKSAALAEFDLLPDRPTLFVFGGSRGARNINRALMDILPELLTDLQIIHLSGLLTWPEVEVNAAGLPADLRAYYRPYPYLHENMGVAFRAADLVVARAGASMLGECPAFGLPSILVPLTFAWRYQKVNADYMTERGAAVQLSDETLAEELLPTIRKLIHDTAQLTAMGAAASALDKPDAAADLARLLLAAGSENQAVPLAPTQEGS